ncbi:MAG TPA: Rpp14/Pop5 family protein [Methanocorpusculum sp.]|nr:Rpp14/Pop5 family protein [Methanocorpusculum sp.]
MRPLPPTLRENHRYLLIKISGEFSAMPSQKEIYYAIRETATKLFGDVGFAQMHIAVIWSDDEHAIIRFRRGWEKEIVACTAMTTKMCGYATAFRTIIISGTIHGVKNHIKSTTWDWTCLPGYRCSGKKVDSLKKNNTQQYLTLDDIHKE